MVIHYNTEKPHNSYQTCHITELYYVQFYAENWTPLKLHIKHSSCNIILETSQCLSKFNTVCPPALEENHLFFEWTPNEVVGLHLGSVLHEECVSLNPRLTLSTVRCSRSGRLPGRAGALLAAHLYSEMHAVSMADARGAREQWTPLPAVNSPFLSLRPAFHQPPNSPFPPLCSPLYPYTPYPFSSLFSVEHVKWNGYTKIM